MPYLFSIIMLSILVFGRTKDRRQLWAMVAFLAIYILFGLYGLTLHPETGTSNPYLTVSPFRIIWVGVVPAVWILVLRSRRVMQFASGATAS